MSKKCLFLIFNPFIEPRILNKIMRHEFGFLYWFSIEKPSLDLISCTMEYSLPSLLHD